MTTETQSYFLGLVPALSDLDYGLVLSQVFNALGHAVLLHSLLIYKVGAELHAALPRGACVHSLLPGLDVGEPVELMRLRHPEHSVNPVVLGRPGHIGVRHLVTHQAATL